MRQWRDGTFVPAWKRDMDAAGARLHGHGAGRGDLDLVRAAEARAERALREAATPHLPPADDESEGGLSSVSSWEWDEYTGQMAGEPDDVPRDVSPVQPDADPLPGGEIQHPAEAHPPGVPPAEVQPQADLPLLVELPPAAAVPPEDVQDQPPVAELPPDAAAPPAEVQAQLPAAEVKPRAERSFSAGPQPTASPHVEVRPGAELPLAADLQSDAEVCPPTPVAVEPDAGVATSSPVDLSDGVPMDARPDASVVPDGADGAPANEQGTPPLPANSVPSGGVVPPSSAGGDAADRPPTEPGLRWTRAQWDDWEIWEDKTRPVTDGDVLNLMQQQMGRAEEGVGDDEADSNAASDARDEAVGDMDEAAGTGQPLARETRPLTLSLREQRALLDAGWPQYSVTHITDFCEYLEWARGEFGAGAVGWALDAWGDALVVAHTTVELAQETLWERLRDSPVVRPEDAGVRGRLTVGFAGFQRQLMDLHVALAQEGLRRQWLPHGVDDDGRQLPEPPFVRGDNAAWAMTRARTLAREMLQRAQRSRAAARDAGAGEPASGEPAEVRDDPGDDAEFGEEEEDDVGAMMQLTVEEEARLHQHQVQDEARRHLRSLMLALNHIQDRGEGPEYRWGVRLVVDAWDASINQMALLRDMLHRRTTNHGALPYFPAMREPPFGALRSRVVAYAAEFRHLLERSLAEEMALQLVERGRHLGDAVAPSAASMGSEVGLSTERGGRNTRQHRREHVPPRRDREHPRGSRSRSPPVPHDAGRAPAVRDPPGLLGPGEVDHSTGTNFLGGASCPIRAIGPVAVEDIPPEEVIAGSGATSLILPDSGVRLVVSAEAVPLDGRPGSSGDFGSVDDVGTQSAGVGEHSVVPGGPSSVNKGRIQLDVAPSVALPADPCAEFPTEVSSGLLCGAGVVSDDPCPPAVASVLPPAGPSVLHHGIGGVPDDPCPNAVPPAPGVFPLDPDHAAEPPVPTVSSGSEVLRGKSEGSVE